MRATTPQQQAAIDQFNEAMIQAGREFRAAYEKFIEDFAREYRWLSLKGNTLKGWEE